MSKKLKIYTSLLICVIVMIFVNTIWEICPYKYSFSNTTESYSSPDERLEFVQEPDSFATHTKNKNGTVSSTYNPTVSFTVDVIPKGSPDSILMSHSFGQDYKVTLNRVKLEVPCKNFTSEMLYHHLPAFILSIIRIIILIWMFCIGIKIICNVRKGNVFITDIANKIETIGKLYIIYWFSNLAIEYAIYASRTIYMANYNIVYPIEDDLWLTLKNIAVALAFMVVSQVILMGKDLKDEQDLTV